MLADYELSLIKERTRSGMRASRAKGKQIGPKKNYFDVRKATEMRDRGFGQIKIARALGVGVGRVNAWANEEYVPQAVRQRVQLAAATMEVD